MKTEHLKNLLKHIILEVNSQVGQGEQLSEMIANKDVEPDVFGAVNVEEGIFDSDVEKKAKELFGKVKKVTKISHPKSNSEYFKIKLENPDSEHIIRKSSSGKLSLGKEKDGKLKFDQIDEETGTGAVAGYSTPFAFKATKKKKKKHVKEGSFLKKVKIEINENHFLNKVKEKIHSSVDSAKSLTQEKILPDGKYADDMEDGRRSNFVAGIKEMTSSSAAGGQPGGTIQVPAWGTKNKLGSPKGIKGSEKLGYKVVRSITNENVESDGYQPINTSTPQDIKLNVRWGTLPNVEYGVAKFAYGKWWNYTSADPNARGKKCATPSAWHSKF